MTIDELRALAALLAVVGSHAYVAAAFAAAYVSAKWRIDLATSS